VTTLLPCGFLYAYVTVAAGTGTPLAGMLVMAAFWAGTVPVMAGLGALAGRALAPLARRLPAISAAALMVIGLLTITGKLMPHAHGASCHEATHGRR
jgi:sulfite exporter TauE/SafE